ncbi:DUF2397 domain-containing protein [Catenulispora rubra]|uniref:DUF2397 domain-containing protein n=1 Tax=Catenulispora rubra TaxID=280293 RepID=UPI0018922E82|nr:DUF2397 domain-containing protein [Catenulispora rubra]
MYRYLTVSERRTYFAIMHEFTSTLLADQSAAEVATALAAVERAGRIEPGAAHIDNVNERLRFLVAWGNLIPGRRETNARSIAEFSQGQQRYQVHKFAIRIQRDAEELLRVSEGVREVTRELLPAIRRTLGEINQRIGETVTAESIRGAAVPATAALREQLSESVTTVFLQHGYLSDSVRDFYAHVGQVVARHDLDHEEIAGLRGLLVEYIQLVVEDVLRHTPGIAQELGKLLKGSVLNELLRLLAPPAALGDAVERSRGRTAEDWHGLAGWFMDRAGRPSQVSALREATATAISSLLFNVKRSTGGSIVSPGRRSELVRLAAEFSQDTDEQAHTRFDQYFQTRAPRHWLDIAEVDQTPSATTWRDGTALSVAVPTSARSERSASGKPAPVVEDPIAEQLILVQAQEAARALEATHAELRAAADRLDTVVLSSGALRALYELIRGATCQRADADSTGRFVHAASGLEVRVGPREGATLRLRAAHGTLTMDDIELEVRVLDAVTPRRGLDGPA